MKRVLAVLLAAACVVASTPTFARGGGGHGFGRAGVVRDPTAILGASVPTAPAFQSRIPSPLPAPSQPPVVNGPSARSPYGGLM